MNKIKIGDFLVGKLNNFKIFINEELNKMLGKNNNVNMDHIEAFNKEIDFFVQNVNVFISYVCTIANNDTDMIIRLFINKYGFDIEQLKNDIDYNKLKRYIEMFKDVIKNNNLV